MSQSQNRGCNRITGPRSDRHCERIGTGLVWKYVAVSVRVQHPAVLFGKVAHKLAINVFRVESYRCFHSAASRLAAVAATGGAPIIFTLNTLRELTMSTLDQCS